MECRRHKTARQNIPLLTSEVVPSLVQSIHSLLPSRPDLLDMLLIVLKKVSLSSLFSLN